MNTVVRLVALCLTLSTLGNALSPVQQAGSLVHDEQWTNTKLKPNPNELITLEFALKQNNLDKLEDILWKVSDPRSETYGNHLSVNEIADLIGSDAEVITQVKQWLNEHNAKSITVSNTRDYIKASFIAADVERLLSVKLNVYSINSGSQRARITRSEDSPMVPDHLAGKLDFISGLWSFPPRESYEKVHISKPQQQLEANYSFVPAFGAGGLPGGMAVQFYPLCDAEQDITESLDYPCSDFGNAITTFSLNYSHYDINTNKLVNKQLVLTNTSDNWPICNILSIEGFSLTACYFVVNGLVNDYFVYNITFSYCFADGSCTLTAENISPVVPSEFRGPIDVKNYYGVPPSLIGSAANNSQAIAAFIWQFFSPSDLVSFFKYFNLPNYTVQNVIGPNDSEYPGAEASLDLQYIMAVGEGVNTWFWSMTGNSFVAEWAQAVLNTPNAPKVHSISYGGKEFQFAVPYLERAEIELQKLAVSGHSVLVASGDEGTDQDCTSYTALWPASSPHVTAVGATRITRGATPGCQANPSGAECEVIGEVSASVDLGAIFSTGGGFSDVFVQPSYQNAAVSKYLTSSGLPPASNYNATGRAYPDISAVGHNLIIFAGGATGDVSGTSAATPIVAGMISLINDQRILAGKNVLGFLNPWLYSLDPSTFYDVTVGDTTYCGDTCCPPSFQATTGWDPASGLGSPRFPVLLKAALALK